jgi:hypothetical protein
MTEIKGAGDLAAKAKEAAKKDDNDRGEARGQHTRLATPAEEAKIKRDARKGDTINRADDDNDIERCRTAKDRETHTRLARPDEDEAIKKAHAKKRAEAAGQTVPPLSAKQQQAAADEAAASVARRQALGGV